MTSVDLTNVADVGTEPGTLPEKMTAWVIRQDALEADSFARMLEEILSRPEQMAARAAAAKGLGHPDAAARLADLVETLGTKT